MAVTREEFNDYIQTLDKIMDWLEQKPTEWQQDHEILKAYSDGANEMRDKIRAEINDYQIAITRCLAAIDKYKADPQESEEV